jgi:hypothetical protein
LNPSTRFDIDKGKSRLLREIVYRVFSRRWRSAADGNLKRSQAVSGEFNLPGLDARADQDGDHLIKQEGKSTAKPRRAQRRSPVRLIPFSSAAVSFPLAVQAAPFGATYIETALTSQVFTRNRAPLGSLAGLHRGHAVGSTKVKGRCL